MFSSNARSRLAATVVAFGVALVLEACKASERGQKTKLLEKYSKKIKKITKEGVTREQCDDIQAEFQKEQQELHKKWQKEYKYMDNNERDQYKSDENAKQKADKYRTAQSDYDAAWSDCLLTAVCTVGGNIEIIPERATVTLNSIVNKPGEAAVSLTTPGDTDEGIDTSTVLYRTDDGDWKRSQIVPSSNTK